MEMQATHKFTIYFLISLFTTVFSSSATGQSIAENSIFRIRKSENFELTGDESESSWDQASWVTLPRRQGSASGYNTKIKLLYSDTGIYGLFSCDDKKITATMDADFADLYLEDVIEAFFWPDTTVSVYFEYELSPRNKELAILVPNIDQTYFGWRPWHYEGDRVTRHATKITDNHWTAEFFIPFKLLKPLIKDTPRSGSRWRMNLYRIDYDEGMQEWSWKVTTENFHEFKKFGILEFQ
jgi:Carbohydrate family 9 binding domain-like